MYFRSELILTAERAQTLRYGENPHQQGAWYYFKGAQQPFLQLQGQKELSYNNIWDMEAAWAIPKEFVSLATTPDIYLYFPR